MYNREKFFSGYRIQFGSIEQSQVDGLNFLLDKLEQDTFTLKQQAYILATVDHESAHTFQPIKEKRGKTLTADQKKYWPSGYYGRGYVQITWKRNYEKFGIADDPDKALEPETAYEILSRGMREGLFTGKSLDDYINGTADYVNARRIINGTDRAAEIAGRARKFEAILTASVIKDSGPTEMKAPTLESQPAVVEPPAAPEKGATSGTGTEAEQNAAGTPPPAEAVDVKASQVSWVSKLASVSIPAGVVTVLTAIANFAKSLPPSAWFAFAGIVAVGMVIGFILWRDKNQQAHERTLKLMDAAADQKKNNLRLV